MSTKEMLQELTLNNVLIKQLSGNVDFLLLKSRDIVGLVWRILKTKNTTNNTSFFPDGFKSVQDEQIEQNRLELEIYCQKNSIVN